VRIASARFAIVSNGFADGPAQALRDFVLEHGAAVITVFHPLVPGSGTTHEIVTYSGGDVRVRHVKLPLGPPLSFALDSLVPLRLPVVDAWFGFNTLATARGLLARRRSRARTVVHWCVDFVPGRFGSTPAGYAYDALDSLCCRRADARVELSVQARDGRDARHGLRPEERAPTRIVPMGAWTERLPTVPEDGSARRTVVFLGHLVPRQGVDLLLEAASLVRGTRPDIRFEVIGGGPEEANLRSLATSLGLTDTVRFVGFLVDHRDVERHLAGASIAVAPYLPTENSFTRYADPGKLKAYLAAGLPTVLTDVPPNAREIAEEGGGEVVAANPAALADAIVRGLSDNAQWSIRRARALELASRYDWRTILGDALSSFGYTD
jgi:glycosyltransferase involved in cell wall biosynthesis